MEPLQPRKGEVPYKEAQQQKGLQLETARRKKAGTSLSAKACLIETRADWDWFQHWMGGLLLGTKIVACVGCVRPPLPLGGACKKLTGTPKSEQD